MSEVTRITPNRATGEAFVTLDKDTAPLLLELVTKAAITGPQAHLLADLYKQATDAAKAVTDEA